MIYSLAAMDAEMRSGKKLLFGDEHHLRKAKQMGEENEPANTSQARV